MLIVTRKELEKIRIADNITVTVLSVDGRQVNIGIDAPKSVAVHRQEIYERIQAERQPVRQSDADRPMLRVRRRRVMESSGEGR